jgi:hypothetical protein
MSSTARRRTGHDLNADIETMSSSIGDALHRSLHSSRLQLARNNLAAVRLRRAQAQQRLDAAIEADRDADRATPSDGLRVAAALVADLDAAVRESRIELEQQVREAAPRIVADIRPHVAVAASLIEELVELLDQAIEPLAEARRVLAAHRVPGVPPVVDRAPALLDGVRSLRAAMNSP